MPPVAVWVDGDLAVNLWGGTADATGVRPWQYDTLASIFSASKALTSTCIHLLADRGELDLQAPIAECWPEFAQAGKQTHHRRHGDEPSLRRDRAAHPPDANGDP